MSYDQKATGGTASFNDYLRTSAGSYDKDILIYCVSQLMAKKNAGEPLAQTLHLNAHDLLVWTNRETSGDAYRRLKDAFERLSGTRITTNIKAGGEEITEGFGLIESWRVIRETKSGRMSELRVRLSDWVYKIIQGSEVLTLSRDYFRLRKPTDRRIYELARKHCGEQDEWKISLELLQKKSGASSYYREFKSMIREVVENDHLPDYQVALEDEMVIFRNRMSFQPKVEVRYPVLDPEAYHDAKLVAPGYDIYYLAWIIHEVSSQKRKDALKGMMNTWVSAPGIPFRSIHRLIQSVLPQLTFSFYRHQPICADFSGGQITSDAGLLPLRAFDQRHHLTCELAAQLNDPRQEDRVQHDAPTLLRQRIYQIVAGYEDANDADRLRHDPLLQIVADQKLGDALGSQPTLSRWENAPSARELVLLNDLLCSQFIRICSDQVRRRGEILLDLDSTDDPTHGQQQLSFFNGAYGQHMYHPMLIFERHSGCLLAARLRPGNASSHARIVPMLLRLVPRLQAAFPGVKIKLRGDAGFALPLLYQFCEFFQIEYALGIPANCVFRRRAEPRQKRLKRRYRRTQLPQRSFSSFRHRARSWPRQRRICYKAEHSAAGTNLRFVITNCPGRASQVFAFYNDRGECENRIEEFKNGFRADRLSCHRFLANAFRLLLHAAAYNLVNFFRLQLPLPWRSAQIETLRAQLFKIGARVRQTARCIRFHLASGWPFQSLFRSATLAVNSS